ncbi:hypothetical protein B0A55_11767 [Friedmanniomyces simplex]|uniref:Uncharacterized protein n=1 Tax=Friedmanniomyces simplex TaxID=329884 RepID=A0A4U0W040_9PEZI|nr:hypothetical protein B0A55_11767 [Friedmanniomyces simplex]
MSSEGPEEDAVDTSRKDYEDDLQPIGTCNGSRPTEPQSANLDKNARETWKTSEPLERAEALDAEGNRFALETWPRLPLAEKRVPATQTAASTAAASTAVASAAAEPVSLDKAAMPSDRVAIEVKLDGLGLELAELEQRKAAIEAEKAMLKRHLRLVVAVLKM